METKLDKTIRKHVKQGYRVIAQDEHSAQLVRPKGFSCLIACVTTLMCGVGLVFYLFWYASKTDDIIHLKMDDKGRVRVTRG